MNPLEDNLYLVRGTNIALLEREYLSAVGVAPTVNQDGEVIDDGLYDTRTVMIPIRRMAEIIMNGFTFSILNIEDIPKIYKVCRDFVDEHRRINASGVYQVYTNEFVDMIENLQKEIETKHKFYLGSIDNKQSFHRNDLRSYVINTTQQQTPETKQVEENKSAPLVGRSMMHGIYK